jgi:hypothetical protein
MMNHFKLPWQHGTTCCWAQGKRTSYSVETTKLERFTAYAVFVKGKYKATFLSRGEAMRRCEKYDAKPWWDLSNPFKE